MPDDPVKRWEALPDEEKQRQLDAHYHLSDRDWVMYSCSDCDPEMLEEGDEGYGEYEHDATVVLPKDAPVPRNCWRCGGYLSMSPPSPVTVSYKMIKKDPSA